MRSKIQPSILSSEAEALWTVQEVAEYLRFEPDTIRAMSREGKLPAIKVGRVWRFRQGQVENWLQTTKLAASGQTNREISE